LYEPIKGMAMITAPAVSNSASNTIRNDMSSPEFKAS
jgi:hypothetical protein